MHSEIYVCVRACDERELRKHARCAQVNGKDVGTYLVHDVGPFPVYVLAAALEDEGRPDRIVQRAVAEAWYKGNRARFPEWQDVVMLVLEVIEELKIARDPAMHAMRWLQDVPAAAVSVECLV